jgi:nicotinamide-nucleotide adenylyltransferase
MESYVLSHFADNPQITFNSLRFEKMELENRGQFHELVYYLNMVPFREQKKSYSSGLVIGRFQPLHKGHMYLFKKALEIAECLEIGIGSSQMSNQPKNPFTYEEREKLIKDAMFEENFTNSQYHIYPIPDLFNFKKWIESIFTIIGDFEVLFTNNLWIGRLIQQRGKILNYGLKHDFENYNGTYIRKLLQLRDDKWKSLVPSSSISFLEKWLRQNPN